MFKLKAGILCTILLFSVAAYGQPQDGSVLEKRVTIIQNNQPLSNILNQLSWQAGVFFSYDATVIDADDKYNIEITDKSLYTILNELFDIRKFNFSERENQVIISQILADENKAAIVNDTIPVQFFFLKGRITSDKKGEPIPYATVSIQNKPIGTISNTDGDFLLKIHPDNIRDTIIFSCIGFSQKLVPAYKILDEDIITLESISIRIKEVKVTATTPQKLLANIRENLDNNYSSDTKIMTAFYRETLKQDENYINISEAVVEILKAPVKNTFRDDIVRLLKGRRSPDVQPFQWLSFKLQGGPFTITKLDVVKTVESFISEEYEYLYKYNISKVIWYNENPVYVLEFQPALKHEISLFVGEIYVHRETFAILHVEFQLNRDGLKKAESLMIKRKPVGVKARPIYVNYQVNYQHYNEKWHLLNATASVKFRVNSKRDNINSVFHSVSELLITNIQDTDLRSFTRNDTFTQNDIFVEMINEYDDKFWENYNIIKPGEDLKNALRNIVSNLYF